MASLPGVEIDEPCIQVNQRARVSSNIQNRSAQSADSSTLKNSSTIPYKPHMRRRFLVYISSEASTLAISCIDGMVTPHHRPDFSPKKVRAYANSTL